MGVFNTVLNAALLSSLYALVAIGFTLVFGVGGLLNLAHGATITVGAFTAYALTTLGIGIWPAAVGAMVVPAALSGSLYFGVIRFIEEQPVRVMIVTLVLSLAVEQVILIVFGAQPKAIPSLLTGAIPIAGGVQMNRVLAFVVSWVVILGLFAAVNYTRTGKAILATSMSTKGAALVGIESDRMYLYTWVLGGFLAGLAGVFLASFQTAVWSMGRQPLVLSFAIVVLGGLGSIRGSVVGAYVIGTLETFVVSYVDPSLSGLASLVVLIAILLVRPEGLFGREFVE